MEHPYAHLYVWSEHSLALAEQCRIRLTEAGFTETRWSRQGLPTGPRNHIPFFRLDTELTAFFVNLEPSQDGLWIRYGFDSVAFIRMKGDEESLLDMGICPEDACLRWAIPITTVVDTSAADQIAAHFRQYQGTVKDDLLRIRKELRKDFLCRINDALKPFGFRKKGSEWRKCLSSGHTLYFSADKGSYSDTYDFDVALAAPPGEKCPRNYCLRITMKPPSERLPNPFMHHPFDWQVNTDADLRDILNRFLTDYHAPLLAGNAADLPYQLLCRREGCPAETCPLRSISERNLL